MEALIAILRPPKGGDPDAMSAILESLLRYGRGHRDWRMEMAPDGNWRRIGGRVDAVLAINCRDKPDGRIAAARLPRVHLIDPDPTGRHPSVIPDEEAIGAMAADHLLEKGLRRFVYVGPPGRLNEQRRRGFGRRLVGRGVGEDHLSVVDLVPSWMTDQRRMGRRIRSALQRVSTPAGLLAFNDHFAYEAIEAALDMGLSVPEDLAVLGIDNSYARCEFARVPISSVDRDAGRIGWEGAALLDRLLSGAKVPPEPVVVAPRAVVQRRSTDAVAVEDPTVARTVALIRERACDGLTVDHVLDEIPVSRSTLERRFREALGRSPAEEIRRERLRRARQLLELTSLPLVDIAVRCGFGSASYLGRAFREAFDQTPAAYRASRQYPGAVEGT